MNRAAMAVIIFLAGLGFVPAFAQNSGGTTFTNATIYEYEGVEREYEELLGSVGFKILDGDILRHIHVWPWAVNIEIRADGQDATTLNVHGARCNDYQYRRIYHADLYCADSVTILVPNQNDLDSWNNYLQSDLNDELSIAGPLLRASARFNPQDGQVVEIETEVASPWHDSMIYVVEVPVESVEVRGDESLRGNEVRFSAEWAHTLSLGGPLLKPATRARSLIIYVSSDELSRWNDQLNCWREQTRPRRILPPQD